MDTHTQLLADLFAGIPGPDDLIGKADGRIIETVINKSGVTPDILGPIASPRDWLARYGIAIEEGSPAEMSNGRAAAVFQHPTHGGKGARVIIPIGYDIDDPKVGWTVWHEIGHAADFIATDHDGKLQHVPGGVYSTLNEGAMRQHQDTIVTWTDNNAPENYEYKHRRTELWAECVACAVMKPAQMPPALLAAILPHLIKRNLPVPESVEWLTQISDQIAALGIGPDGGDATRECSPPPDLATLGHAALRKLEHFMSAHQARAVREYMQGEEAAFFHQKMIELAAIVESMPTTGQTDDGRGDEAIVHLHYFAGGQANFYITERDVGAEDDPLPGAQNQAWGRADLFGDGGELGYISLPEIFSSRGELDFHWTPKTLDAIAAELHESHEE